MEIVPMIDYTSDIRVLPHPYLFTVCDDNVTAETFIDISNNEGEEVVSTFIGAPPAHLNQSGVVAGIPSPYHLCQKIWNHLMWTTNLKFS